MIPTYLNVRNFMCYRGPVELDFTGIRVACLSGDNGAGKSALLDCITWALWGKARVNSDRELMALGATEMEVVFGFILNDQEFRVSRRRTRRGTGPLVLEFHARDTDRWRVLTGTSTRETQKTIDNLLKMDYDTFINSAFILQGRADEFTTKTPALRKQVLGEILNLGDYDRYEEVARQHFREGDRQLREIDARVLELDQALAELPHRRAEVEACSHELVTLGERADHLRERLELAQGRLQTLEFTASQREAVRQQRAALLEEISTLETSQRETQSRIDEHRAVLARRHDIEARFTELTRLRQRQEQLSSQLAERQELLDRQRQLEQAVQAAVHEIQMNMHSLDQQITDRRGVVEGKAQLAQEIDTVERQTAELAEVDAEIRRLRCNQSRWEMTRGELQAENRQLRSEMDAVKAKLDQLEAADARCPVCQRDLGPTERERLQEDYTVEGKTLAERYRANAARMKQLDADAAENASELRRLEQRRKDLEVLSRQSATLSERMSSIERAEREIAELSERRQVLAQTLEAGTPGREHREELTQIESALSALRYDREEHRAVQTRLSELSSVDEERRRLDIAEAALEGEERQLVGLDGQLERTRHELARIEQQETELSQQLEQLEPVRRDRDDLQTELDQLDRQRGELQERFGAAQQRLNDCLRLQDTRDELLAERGRVAEDKKIYDELVLAFGKRGIQAMVIENVVPELQDEANAILDKMPGNTMRVEFRTQRQAVRGENTIETLDLMISDEAGRRPYELYSGGEAFRANFAIRVALSTLLARRAGARLETLVIDEGFGTQDARGRDGLIEAIHAIEADFQMILIITHIAEMKEVFPDRIDVVKTPTGSQIMVN